MDSLSSEDNDEESSNILRDTGHPSFKKVKRTRMNVDHLTEDEKHLRKRLLGRERARRYRERKRAVESFFEAVVGQGGLVEHKPRGVQPRRTCTRKKRKKILRFASVSKEIARGGGEQDKSSSSISYHLEKDFQQKIGGNAEAQNPETFQVSSLLSVSNLNPDAILKVSVPTLEVDVLDKDAGPLNKGSINSSFDKKVLALDDTLCQLSKKNMEVSEVKISQIKKLSEAMESSSDEVNLSKKTRDLPSGSKDNDELTENPHTQKKPFKQQNVKDFINLFPVEHPAQIDGTTPVSSCNSGMQRKVECVTPSRRSSILKSSIRDLQVEAESDVVKSQMAKDDKPVEGEHGGPSVEAKTSSGVGISTSKPDEKTKVTHSEPQAGTSVPQASLTPMLPIADLPLPIVIDSTSAQQPFAVAGLQFPQTLQNTIHMPSVMQQQFVGAVGNIHALNTLQASGQSRIVSTQDLKQSVGIPAIIGSTHGVQGIQGTLGNPSNCQGGGVQGTGGIQGLFGDVNGISALQGVSNLLGIGCLPGIAGPTSPTGLPGLQSVAGVQGITNVVPSLQGISNFQAAVQGIPALQGVTGLQGLVNLQTLSTLQGIQGLQGVGISALQGQQTLAGLQAITGASPLLPGFSVQAGTLGQLGVLGAVGQDSAFNQVEVMRPATTEGCDPQQTPSKPSPVEEKETSPTMTSSTCPEPNITSKLDPPCTEKKQLYPICKGRSSRRKQASPRCISKHNRNLFFDSKEDSGEEEDQHIAWTSVTENMERGQQNSTDLETRLPSNQSPMCMKSTTSSPKIGSKLSKKVEELLSATNPEHLGVHVECPTDPVDDESPSPQTWRRFLERERQRNDRLREVEQQLAKLQVLTAGASSVGSKSLTSMSTQTDPQDFLGIGDGAEERLVKARTNLLWQTTQGIMEHTERNRRTCGQIQQRVVTSSGDPHDMTLALDANKSQTQEMDSLASFQPSEMPQQPSDIEGTTIDRQERQIVNRPGNYWLHSVKRKRIAGRKASPSVKLREGAADAGSSSIKQEEMRELNMSNEDPLSLVPKKKRAKKYIYQISPEDSVLIQAAEFPENATDGPDLLDCRVDNQSSPLKAVTDGASRVNIEQHLSAIKVEPSPVLPWDVEGLTKIERNRIRAREGMRRHREKLKMAKLSNQGWRCHEMPGISSFVEKAIPTQGSKPLVHSGYLSPRGKKGGQKLKSDSKCSRANSTHNEAYMIENDVSTSIKMSDLPILSGEDLSKKTFQVFTPVATETELNITRFTPSPKGWFKTNPTAVPGKGLGKELFDVSAPAVPDATVVQFVHPGTNLTSNRREKRRKGWLKSEQRFERNSTLLEMPKDTVIHSLPTSDQIDFTQEPYRSMSLRERNRIRAREGMRRYRERLKMARISSHQAHQRVTHMLPRSGRGTFKRGTRKMELDKGTGTVSVEEPSQVPGEISSKKPNLPVSYSEMLELQKTETLKRRRSVHLLKTNAVKNKSKVSQRCIEEGTPEGELRLAGVFIKRETVPEEELEEHMKNSKFGNVKCFPVMREKEQGNNENTDEEKSVDEEAEETHSLAAESFAGADEVEDDAEKQRLEHIEKMKEHLETIRRQRLIDEKMACGMDRYAAISSSKSTENHGIDHQVLNLLQESQDEEGGNDEETLCSQDAAIIKADMDQAL